MLLDSQSLQLPAEFSVNASGTTLLEPLDGLARRFVSVDAWDGLRKTRAHFRAPPCEVRPPVSLTYQRRNGISRNVDEINDQFRVPVCPQPRCVAKSTGARDVKNDRKTGCYEIRTETAQSRGPERNRGERTNLRFPTPPVVQRYNDESPQLLAVSMARSRDRECIR